ncbi:hypothetical protein [Persephonella sp.]
MGRVILFLMTVFLISCGGGGGSSEGELIEGYFYDSPVENLYYKTSSGVEGVTDRDGKFYYREGDKIKFFTGSILIGEVSGDYIISPLDLFKGYKKDIKSDDPLITQMVAYFLSIDVDPNDFIITIDDGKVPNINLTDSLTKCLFEKKCPKEIMNLITPYEVEAGKHFQDSYKAIMKEISGCYEGQLIVTNIITEALCGINGGILKIYIYSSGTVEGIYQSRKINGFIKYKDLSFNIPTTYMLSIEVKGEYKRNKFSGEWTSPACQGTYYLSKVDNDQCQDIVK